MSKIPISQKRQYSSSNELENVELFMSLQDNLKLFLSFLIVLNFLIIFYVKFYSENKNKLKSFLLDEDEESKKSIENNKDNDKEDKDNDKDKDKDKEENSKQKKNRFKKDILLIIAHPDDEVMFFTPTLNNLLYKIDRSKYDINVRILCLSNGNYDKIGDIREREFSDVMKSLRIENYEILNDENLQDDINTPWNKKIVSEKIYNYLSSKEDEGFNNITHILTFDDLGVTKHPNHISCYYGLE